MDKDLVPQSFEEKADKEVLQPKRGTKESKAYEESDTLTELSQSYKE